MTLSPHSESFTIIYDGQKVIWSLRATIDVLIVEHSEHFIIEILGYNPETGQESPRLYLDTFKVDEKINAYEIVSIAPSSNQQHSPTRAKNEKRNEFRKKFLLSRLGVSSSALRLKTFELCIVPNDGEKLRDIYCVDIPSKLTPVAADHFKLHGSISTTAALSWQKSQQKIESSKLPPLSAGTVPQQQQQRQQQQSRFNSRANGAGNTHGFYHRSDDNSVHNANSIGVSSDDNEMNFRSVGLQDGNARGSFDNAHGLWERMRWSMFSSGDSSKCADVSSSKYQSQGSAAASNSAGASTSRKGRAENSTNQYDLCLKSVDEEEDFAQMQARMHRVQLTPISPRYTQQQHLELGGVSLDSLSSTSSQHVTSSKVRVNYGLSVLAAPKTNALAAAVEAAVVASVPESKSIEASYHISYGVTAPAQTNNQTNSSSIDSWRGRRLTVATVPDSSEFKKAAAFTGGQLNKQQHKEHRDRERRRSFHRRRAGVLGQLGISKNQQQTTSDM